MSIDISKTFKHEYKFYGLSIFEIDDKSWVIGSESQLRKAAKAKIKEELWAYNATYIIDFLNDKYPKQYQKSLIKTFQMIQESLCENASPVIEAMIGIHIDEFIDNVIKDDGLGNILSNGDGKIQKTRDVPWLKSGYGPLCLIID